MRTVRVHLPTPTQEVTLCPLGDIQWAGDRGDIAYDHLVEHIQEIMRQPAPVLIGMGDYIDFASPSNREALRQARLYDTARKVIADSGTNLVEQVYTKFLEPTRGKWAGLLEGHHHHVVRIVGEDDTERWVDSDVYLAEKLNTEYLAEMAIVKLRWPNETAGGPLHGVNVLAFHGSGSSVFPWGPLNKLYRIAPNFNVDIFLQGHHTKVAKANFDFIDPVDDDVLGDRLAHRPRHLIGTGGWGRGYIEGRSTYVSAGALTPVTLGQPLIHIRPRYRVTTSTGARVWEASIKEES